MKRDTEEVVLFGDVEWRLIPGFHGYYASKNGEILSAIKPNKPIVLRQIGPINGHKYVFLYRNIQREKMFVHRLILSAWDRLPIEGEVARHLNDIPTDNRLENLAWGTVGDNMADKIRNGRTNKGTKAPTHKLSEKDIMLIREKYADGVGSFDLSKEYKVSQNQILMIVKGRSWKHLPLVPVREKHIVKRRKPMTEQEHRNRSTAMKKAKEKCKIPRFEIPCACGCGTMIPNFRADGRPQRFVWGHNARVKNTE